MTDFFTMQPGETAAPLPPGPVLCMGTAGMRRIHRFFLWAYDEAPGLVRSAAAGDTARAAYVGEVLGNFDKVLHLHHDGEGHHEGVLRQVCDARVLELVLQRRTPGAPRSAALSR